MRTAIVIFVLLTASTPALNAQAFQWPVMDPDKAVITQQNACRKCCTGCTGARYQQGINMHTGVDIIPGDDDFTVVAPASGKVAEVLPMVPDSGIPTNHGLGNVVIVEHPDYGVYTLYAHLAEISVTKGQSVIAGVTPIGEMGNTPGGFGIHLHFEVKRSPRLENHSDVTSALYWGYTPGHPDLYNTFDPLSFIDPTCTAESIAPTVLENSTGDAVSVLSAPGLTYWNEDTNVIGIIGADQKVVTWRRCDVDDVSWFFVDLPSRNGVPSFGPANNGPHGGWVSGNDLHPAESQTRIEVLSTVNVRTGQGTAHPIIAQLFKGQRLVPFGEPELSTDTACSGLWHQLYLPGNESAPPTTGWSCNETPTSTLFEVLDSILTSFTMRVINSRTAEPVIDADVTWGAYATTTDNDGRFSFTDVPCVTNTLRVTKTGYVPYEESYTPPCHGSVQPVERGCEQDGLCDTLIASAAGDPPRFEVGDTVRVFNTGIGLRAWENTCTGSYTVKQDGTTGVIQEGPICCGGHLRWRIRYANDPVDRWSAEGDPDSGEFWLWKRTGPQPLSGSIVGWGSQVVGVDLSGPFAAVAAGRSHSLGLKADGSIVAWGGNSSGQTDVPSPNTGFVAVAAGGSHSLGLKVGGSILAWGYSDATKVPGPNTGFMAIAAGGSHSLGLKDDGSIVAWGYNHYGQLNVPAPNTGFAAVAAGAYHSLGLRDDGSIVAWGCGSTRDYGQCNVPEPNTGFVAVGAGGGMNSSYSLGLKEDGSIVGWGSGTMSVPTPNANFIAIDAGGYHSIGLKNDGSIAVWGCGPFGDDICTLPTMNGGFVGIAAGGGGKYREGHALALRGDGSIVAWGSNSSGQCNLSRSNLGYFAVSGGYGHTLGLKGDGSIVAWGRNDYGQSNIPLPNTGFVGVAAGGFHSIALKRNGVIVAWGRNDYGQSNIPLPNTGFIAVAAGYTHSLAVRSDGSIVAWGADFYGKTNVPSPNTGFIDVAGGWNHSLGLKTDGSGLAWGWNGNGQTNVPTPIRAFVSIVSLNDHSLGLKDDGSIVAWGKNNYGQTNVPEPNAGFVAVAAGWEHSLGLKADGSIAA